MKGELFDLKVAEAQASVVMMALAPACHRVTLAGSMRRRKAQVHDIDIVAWPLCEEVAAAQTSLFGASETKLLPVKLIEILHSSGMWLRTADDYPRKIVLEPGEGHRVPVEIYLAEPDGRNLGALIQMRTGSDRFNVSLAQRAIRMGLQYKAGYGIFRDGERLDDGSEEGIFRALGLDWCPPTAREDDYHAVMMKR